MDLNTAVKKAYLNLYNITTVPAATFPGDTVCRNVTIINNGQFSRVDEFTFIDIHNAPYGTFTSFKVYVIEDGVEDPTPIDVMSYIVQTPDSINLTLNASIFGGADNTFSVDDGVRIEYCFETKCPEGINQSQLVAQWGCSDLLVCQRNNSNTAQVNISFNGAPDVTTSFTPFVPTNVCTDTVKYCYKIYNEGFEILDGEGAAAQMKLIFNLNDCKILNYSNFQFSMNGAPISAPIVAQTPDSITFQLPNLQVGDTILFKVNAQPIEGEDIVDCEQVATDFPPDCLNPYLILRYADLCSGRFEKTRHKSSGTAYPWSRPIVSVTEFSYTQPSYCTAGTLTFELENKSGIASPATEAKGFVFFVYKSECDWYQINNFRYSANPAGPYTIVPTSDIDATSNDSMYLVKIPSMIMPKDDIMYILYDIDLSSCSNDEGSCRNEDPLCNKPSMKATWINCQGMRWGAKYMFPYNLFDHHPVPQNSWETNAGGPISLLGSGCGHMVYRYRYLYDGIAPCPNLDVRLRIKMVHSQGPGGCAGGSTIPTANIFVPGTHHTSTSAGVVDDYDTEIIDAVVDTFVLTIHGGEVVSKIPQKELIFEWDYAPQCCSPTAGTHYYFSTELIYDCPGCCTFQRGCWEYETDCFCGTPGPPPVLCHNICLEPNKLNLWRTTVGSISSTNPAPASNADPIDFGLPCDTFAMCAIGSFQIVNGTASQRPCDTVSKFIVKVDPGNYLRYCGSPTFGYKNKGTTTIINGNNANIVFNPSTNEFNVTTSINVADLTESDSVYFTSKWCVKDEVQDLECSAMFDQQSMKVYFNAMFKSGLNVPSCGSSFVEDQYFVGSTKARAEMAIEFGTACELEGSITLFDQCLQGKIFNDFRPNYILDSFVLTVNGSTPDYQSNTAVLRRVGELGILNYNIPDADITTRITGGNTIIVFKNPGNWPIEETNSTTVFTDSIFNLDYKLKFNECYDFTDKFAVSSSIYYHAQGGCGVNQVNANADPDGFQLPNAILEYLGNATVISTSDTVCWDVRVGKTPKAALSWLAFEHDANLEIYKILDVTNPAAPIDITADTINFGNGKVYIKNDAIAYRDIRICGLFEICDTVRANVYAGWSCTAYPANPITGDFGSGESCEILRLPLKAARGLAAIQGIIRTQPMSSVKLCDTIVYEMVIKNVGSASTFVQQLYLTVPDAGLTIVPGSFCLSYPDTFKVNSTASVGSYVMIPDPDMLGNGPFGDSLYYDFSDPVLQATLPTSWFNASGQLELPGAKFPENNLNTFAIKFKAVTDCEFISGGRMYATITAEDRCSNKLSDDQQATNIIAIENLDPRNFNRNKISILEKEIGACTGSQTLTVNVESFPFVIKSNEFICVELPPGFTYVDGSAIGISPLSWDLTMVSQEVIAPGQIKYCFKMPAGSDPGVLAFNINVLIDESKACGDYIVKSYTFAQDTAICVRDASECVMKLNTSDDGIDTLVLVPGAELLADRFKATLSCGENGKIKVTANVGFMNLGSTIPAGSPINVLFFHDANGNAAADAGEGVHNFSYTGGAVGDQIVLANNIMFETDWTNLCPLYVTIGSLGCACAPIPAIISDKFDLELCAADAAGCDNSNIQFLCAGLPTGLIQELTFSSTEDPTLQHLDGIGTGSVVFNGPVGVFNYSVSLNLGTGCVASGECEVRSLDCPCGMESMTLAGPCKPDGSFSIFVAVKQLLNPGSNGFNIKVNGGTVQSNVPYPTDPAIMVELPGFSGVGPFTISVEDADDPNCNATSILSGRDCANPNCDIDILPYTSKCEDGNVTVSLLVVYNNVNSTGFTYSINGSTPVVVNYPTSPDGSITVTLPGYSTDGTILNFLVADLTDSQCSAGAQMRLPLSCTNFECPPLGTFELTNATACPGDTLNCSLKEWKCLRLVGTCPTTVNCELWIHAVMFNSDTLFLPTPIQVKNYVALQAAFDELEINMCTITGTYSIGTACGGVKGEVESEIKVEVAAEKEVAKKLEEAPSLDAAEKEASLAGVRLDGTGTCEYLNWRVVVTPGGGKVPCRIQLVRPEGAFGICCDQEFYNFGVIACKEPLKGCSLFGPKDIKLSNQRDSIMTIPNMDLSYNWTLPGGGGSIISQNGPNVSLQFDAVGTYEVCVIISDPTVMYDCIPKQICKMVTVSTDNLNVTLTIDPAVTCNDEPGLLLTFENPNDIGNLTICNDQGEIIKEECLGLFGRFGRLNEKENPTYSYDDIDNIGGFDSIEVYVCEAQAFTSMPSTNIIADIDFEKCNFLFNEKLADCQYKFSLTTKEACKTGATWNRNSGISFHDFMVNFINSNPRQFYVTGSSCSDPDESYVGPLTVSPKSDCMVRLEGPGLSKFDAFALIPTLTGYAGGYGKEFSVDGFWFVRKKITSPQSINPIAPGDYTVKIEGTRCGEVNILPFEIPEIPSSDVDVFVSSLDPTTCTSTDGNISLTSAANGVIDSIVLCKPAPEVSTVVNLVGLDSVHYTGAFTGLPVGVYTVKVYTECDDVAREVILVSQSDTAYLANLTVKQFTDCASNDAKISFNAFSSSPIDSVVIKGPSGYYFSDVSVAINDMIMIGSPLLFGTYEVAIYSNCYSFKQNVIIDAPLPSNAMIVNCAPTPPATCNDAGSICLNISYIPTGTFAPDSIVITGPALIRIVDVSHSNTPCYDNLPVGVYTITVYDYSGTCNSQEIECEVLESTNSISITSMTTPISPCLKLYPDSTVYVKVNYNYDPSSLTPVRIEWYLNGSLLSTDFTPGAIGDSVAVTIAGNYCARVYTGSALKHCPADTMCVTILQEPCPPHCASVVDTTGVVELVDCILGSRFNVSIATKLSGCVVDDTIHTDEDLFIYKRKAGYRMILTNAATNAVIKDVYSWNSACDTFDINNLSPGDYHVEIFPGIYDSSFINGVITLEDNNPMADCEAVSDFTLRAADDIVYELKIETTNTTCGNAEGTATVAMVMENGMPLDPSDFTYKWSKGFAVLPGSGASISGLTANVYSVVLIDRFGCERAMKGFVIIPTNGPKICPVGVLSATNCGGCNGIIIMPNKDSLPGANFVITDDDGNVMSPVSFVDDNIYEGLCPGHYHIVTFFADPELCPAYCDTTLLIDEDGLNIALDSISGSPCVSNDGRIVVSAIDGGNYGPYDFELKTAVGTSLQIVEDDVDGVHAFAGLAPGLYKVIVRGATGEPSCMAMDTIRVEDNDFDLVDSNISTVDATCFDLANGQININAILKLNEIITISGPIPSTTVHGVYNASSPTPFNISGLDIGTYKVVISGGYGVYACEKSFYTKIEEPILLEFDTDKQNPSDCITKNGSIAVTVSGGTAPYDIVWSDPSITGFTATGLGNGTYSFVVTDDNDCTMNGEVTLSLPYCNELCPPNMAEIGVVDAHCGSSDGSAFVTVLANPAGFSYLWSTGANTQTINNLAPGIYTVTVTNLFNDKCSEVKTVPVGTIDGPDLTVTDIIPANCIDDDAIGQITLTINQGTSPFDITITNPSGVSTTNNDQTSNTILLGELPGKYLVTVVDASGCIDVIEIELPQAPSLTVNATTLAAPGCNINNGRFRISVVDGSPNYIYEVNGVVLSSDNNANSFVVADVAAGVYIVKVTDANGCFGYDTLAMRSGGLVINPSHWAFVNSTCASGYGTIYHFGLGSADELHSLYLTGSTAPIAQVAGNVTDTFYVSPGEYFITCVNALGCSDILSGIKLSAPDALDFYVWYEDPTCSGRKTDGEISVNNIVGDYEIADIYFEYFTASHSLIQSGFGMDAIADLAPGNYFVRVSYINGNDTCRKEVAVNLDNPDCFDLALRKVITTPAPHFVGQVVNYAITVFNQDRIPARNIVVTDSLPCGLTFINDPLVNPNWTVSGGQVTINVPGTLLAGQSATVNLNATVTACASLDSYINIAEIKSATDTFGVSGEDIDSDPDFDPSNDDDVVDNEISDPLDEDDHDIEELTLSSFDLALNKTLAPGQSSYVQAGDQVKFAINVFNQGTVAAYNVDIVDYIPSGLLFVNDPVLNAGWTDSDADGNYERTIAGPIAAGGNTTIYIYLQVNPSQASPSSLINWSEISDAEDATGNHLEDIDSDPDDDQANDNYTDNNDITGDAKAEDEDEDDQDQEVVQITNQEVFDLALRKQISAIQTLPVYVGDDVTFTITVVNQGTIAAQNIEISDYIPAGLAVNDADWSDFDNDGIYEYFVAGPIAPGAEVSIDLTTKIISAPAGPNFTYQNFAEISAAEDTDGNHPVDIDSEPDDNSANDNFDINDDDEISENGNAGEDDDDHDIASIQVRIFDLALTKKIDPTETGPFTPGNVITFEIEVFNQGNVSARNIVIEDYIPAGLALSPTDANGWSNIDADPNMEHTISATIAPASSVIVRIDLIILPTASGQIINYAEISDAQDDSGNHPTDIDSDPDGTNGNDIGGMPLTSTDNQIDNDGTVDEDDHDPALINVEVFDLALTKKLAPGQSTYVLPLADVNYVIEVCNQGTIPAYAVDIAEYVPSGLSLSPLDANGWTDIDANGILENTIPGAIDPNTCASVNLRLRLEAGVGDGSTVTNWAEISDAEDEDGNHLPDVDSDPDNDPDNDNYTADDQTDGDAKNNDEDEDDHDPAEIIVELDQVYDLALTKKIDPTQSTPVYPGQDVKYVIEILNQGNQNVTNVDIIDYIPTGMTLSATNPNGWTSTAGGVTKTIASIAAGASATEMLWLTLLPTYSGTTARNFAEISDFESTTGTHPDDIDSEPNDIPSDDEYNDSDDDVVTEDGNTPGEDEDDHDPADIDVARFDLALRKTIASTQATPIKPGDDIMFKIEVFNQGNIAAHDITVDEVIPAGLTYSLNDMNGWLNLDADANLEKVIAGPIVPGGSQVVYILLTVNPAIAAATSLTNIAEISDAQDPSGNHPPDIDSDPDGDPNNDGSPVDNAINDPLDEDDEDIEIVNIVLPVYDLALRKKIDFAATGNIKIGAKIVYNICVFNQGNQSVSNIEITDHMPVGLSYNSADNTHAWSDIDNDGVYEFTYSGTLAPMDSICIPIVLTLDAVPVGSTMMNIAEISGMDDEDGNPVTDEDSTPDMDPNNDGTPIDNEIDDPLDQDDQDIELLPVYDLALRKTCLTTTPVVPGDHVTFRMEVFNQGNQIMTNVVVTDHIPDGFILANPDPHSWTFVSSSEVNKTIASIAPGASAFVDIELVVKVGAQYNTLKNKAEISSMANEVGDPVSDIDSDPDRDPLNDGDPIDDEVYECCGIDEDDHDISEPPVMDLALRKTTNQVTPVRVGDLIRFKIELFNQGNMTSTNHVMVDYMPTGFTFPAAQNPNWTLDPSNDYLTYNMATTLLPGMRDSAILYLTVAQGASTNTLINNAEITHMESEGGIDMTSYDIDSHADTDPDNDAGGDPFGETNDVIDGDGTGPIGAGDPDFDEDDADAAHLVMCGQISCKGNINFSLDSLCMGVLTPGALLSPVASPLFAYEITVKDQWGNAHENKFDGSDIGKCFSVTIRDTFCGGNSCWSTVCIEDKYAPRIVCDTDTVSCARFMLGGLEPEVIENCGTATVTLLDERIFALPCDPDFIKRIERDYIAVDGSGNVSEKCTWVLYIERTNIYETITPKDTIFQCSANYTKDVDGHPHPSVVGVPTLDGDTIWPVTDLLCNIVVDYRDEEYPEVACVKRILRTWRIREWWCNQELTYTRPQWITLKDTVGPVITKHAYDMEATTSNRSCTAKVTLPSIEAVDACHTVVRIDIIFPGGILTNQNGGVVELPIGEDTVIYRVYDNCYNMTADTIIVTVKDDTEPIAICDRKTVVALNRSGFNWVPADVFDDGSFDECHIHHFEVRRMDDNSCGTTGADDWGPEVGFCCEDVGKEIMIGFKVIDGSGNEAICMVLAEVQDKEAPIIVSCPPNITVDCRFPIDLNRLDLSFGTVATSEAARNPIVIDPKYYHLIDGQPLDGLAQDNCPPIVREVVDSSGFDQCGHGVIKRNFIITDQQGNSTQCTQLITVDNFANPFDENDITWPLDFDTTGLCDARILLPELLTNPLYKQPTFSDDVCSKIGVSYSDHYFNSSPSSANKIYRVWKVIDWCQAMSGSPTIFVDTQLIRIINTIPPTILDGCRDTSLCSYDASCSDVAIRFPIKAEDDCNGPDELLYTFSIDLHSDGTIDWTTAGVAAYMVNRSWPVGTHRVTWEVEDLNGNISRCSFTAELKNCKSPIAYCHYGIAVGLTPTDLNGNGSFDPYPVDNEIDTVWAKDIDAGSYNICGTGVKLSFSRDTADKFKVFTCDHANTRQDVELWVTDIYGNQSYCRTYILVQDNNNVPICPSNLTATVSGLISTEESQQVESVDVSMDKSKAEIVKSNFDGEYKFKTTQVGNDYEIKPEKNDDWLNGVTTADIVKIQKHILGINEITSPYKMIAADVNKSGTVTAKDISDLRKLILGVTADVSTNTSWRFADATYPFRDAESAITEAFPESYKIVPLLSDMKVDFKGIKIGDLNESAKTRGVMGISTRSAIRLKLNIEEKLISADEIQAVEFGSDNIENYDGFQMTLTYDANALELQEIIGNHEVGMQRENFHIIRKGMITMSWDGKATNKDKLFTIIFKSKVEGSLSKYIHLSSAVTPALAIAKGEKLEDEIELIATNKSNEQIEFAVMQNEPNPWSKETHIGMFLPTSGEVQMTIYDAAGKVFLQEEKLLKGGYNEWNVDDNILPQSGVYYYQVDFAGQTITKKMVFVK